MYHPNQTKKKEKKYSPPKKEMKEIEAWRSVHKQLFCSRKKVKHLIIERIILPTRYIYSTYSNPYQIYRPLCKTNK